MLKILINSYTCCPNMGSEPGMGWNWITNLARYCEVYVISEGEYRPEIEAWLEENANDVKFGIVVKNLHFYWNPVTPEIRKMCWNQGDWRFYKYYEEWQRKTADMARQICQETKIDLLHQLNMIGFREPGYLWKVSKETDIPFAWGPIGGLKQFPMRYADGGGLKMKVFSFIKNAINIFQIKCDRRVNAALEQADILISSIPDSYRAIKKYKGLESEVIPETGCRIPEITEKQKVEGKQLDILWVGKFDFRKRLDIALETMAKVNNEKVHLTVYGSGNESQVIAARELSKALGIEDRVTFMGNKPNDEVNEAMCNADLFLFTSINEDTSTVVLEAVSNLLPVLCFECCGMAAVIDDKVGRKIPLSTPSQSVRDFAEAIDYFAEHREELRQLSANCYERACELSWDNKARQVIALYEKALNK